MKRKLTLESHYFFVLFHLDHAGTEYSVPRPFVRHFDATVYKLFPDVDKKSFKVLDVAAGTGLLGLELNKVGYTYIDALADRSVQ